MADKRVPPASGPRIGLDEPEAFQSLFRAVMEAGEHVGFDVRFLVAISSDGESTLSASPDSDAQLIVLLEQILDCAREREREREKKSHESS